MKPYPVWDLFPFRPGAAVPRESTEYPRGEEIRLVGHNFSRSGKGYVSKPYTLSLYAPTDEELAVISSRFPLDRWDGIAPDWLRVRTELIAAGQSTPRDVAELSVPDVVAILKAAAPPSEIPAGYVTATEAALTINLTKPEISKLATAKKIPHHKVGRNLYVDAAALIKFKLEKDRR